MQDIRICNWILRLLFYFCKVCCVNNHVPLMVSYFFNLFYYSIFVNYHRSFGKGSNINKNCHICRPPQYNLNYNWNLVDAQKQLYKKEREHLKTYRLMDVQVCPNTPTGMTLITSK